MEPLQLLRLIVRPSYTYLYRNRAPYGGVLSRGSSFPSINCQSFVHRSGGGDTKQAHTVLMFGTLKKMNGEASGIPDVLLVLVSPYLPCD